jgi:hypothetical protein
MTQSLPPDMQVSVVFGDIMMDVNDDETGVGKVEIEGKKYSVFAITPQMKENG